MKSLPDFYRIRVRGHLDQRWAEWFDGFELEVIGKDTVLCGPIRDQSALHGMFAKIRDLGLEILLVKKMDGDENETL